MWANIPPPLTLHQLAVLRTAYGVVGNSHLAEDIALQVFVELFTAIRRYDPERPFAPWLIGSWSISASRSFDGATIETFHWKRSPPVCLPSTRSLTWSRRNRRSIWAAVRALSPKQRAAVVLRYYHGFSETEMAIALGCRRGTVKSRLHSALRRLEFLLRDSGTPEGEFEHGRDTDSPSDAV